MTTLVKSLNEQSMYSKGELFIIETSNPDESNVAFKTDVDIASEKNWTVWNWLGSREQSLPYIGSDPTSINELQAQGIHIYNTIGYLHIDNETPQLISIFTLDGRMIVEQFTKYLNVPVSSGIYIVKIDNTAMKVTVR